MDLLDIFSRDPEKRREKRQLEAVLTRVYRYSGAAQQQREELCRDVLSRVFTEEHEQNQPLFVASWQLCQALLAYEGHLYLPTLPPSRDFSLSEMWELKAALTRALVPFEQPAKLALLGNALTILIQRFTDSLPRAVEGETATLAVPLYALLRDLPDAFKTVFGVAFNTDLIRADLFERLRARLKRLGHN